MFVRTRNEIDQVELLPTRGWVQVKETSIRELVGDDGSVEELGRTPHRRVVTPEDAAEMAAIFTALNTTATTAVTELTAQVAALTEALNAAGAEASACRTECATLKVALAEARNEQAQSAA